MRLELPPIKLTNGFRPIRNAFPQNIFAIDGPDKFPGSARRIVFRAPSGLHLIEANFERGLRTLQLPKRRVSTLSAVCALFFGMLQRKKNLQHKKYVFFCVKYLRYEIKFTF